MAKATPEEKAMHALAEKDIDQALENQLENPAPIIDETPSGDETVISAPPPKRGRGRPSNAEKLLNETLVKETVGDDGATTATAKKPGRTAGKSGKGTMDPAALGNQLVGIHALAAMFTQIPELQLQPQEGNALAQAVINVCQEYDLSLSGKTGAGIQLLAAAAMIYAPRLMHYKARVTQAQAQPQQQGEFYGPQQPAGN